MKIHIKTNKAKVSCAILSDARKDVLDEAVNIAMRAKLEHIAEVSENFSEGFLRYQERF